MNIKTTYCGVIVPMVTPLDASGAVDPAGVEKIIAGLVKNRCAPFVAGTTGESASLSDAEKERLVGLAVSTTNGRQIVYAGIADNCFEASVEKAHRYKELGADAVVAHLPCYYPIDEGQMAAYFGALADASPLPLLLYNIPVTTKLSVPVTLLDELSQHENVVGAKDSERSEERLRDCLDRWRDREDFTFHLGWAAKSAFGLLDGLDGIVPSSANLVPHLYRGIYDAAKSGDAAEANRLQAITDIISAYYQEGFPLSQSIPRFKTMLEAFDICQPHVALPMITLCDDERATVIQDAQSQFSQYLTE